MKQPHLLLGGVDGTDPVKNDIILIIDKDELPGEVARFSRRIRFRGIPQSIGISRILVPVPFNKTPVELFALQLLQIARIGIMPLLVPIDENGVVGHGEAVIVHMVITRMIVITAAVQSQLINAPGDGEMVLMAVGMDLGPFLTAEDGPEIRVGI
jgi:hypothetical protein